MSPTTVQCRRGADTSTLGQKPYGSGIRRRHPRPRHEARQSAAESLAGASGARSDPLGGPRSARGRGGGSLVRPDAAAGTANAVRRSRLGVPLRPFKRSRLRTERRKLPSRHFRHPPRAIHHELPSPPALPLPSWAPPRPSP